MDKNTESNGGYGRKVAENVVAFRSPPAPGMTTTRAKTRTRKAKREEPDADAVTYVDHTAAAIHESISDLVDLGLVESAVMGEVDGACLTKFEAFTASQLKALREREQATQTVFANYLGVSVNTVGQWERGERRATGAAAKLLSLVERHGLAYIR